MGSAAVSHDQQLAGLRDRCPRRREVRAPVPAPQPGHPGRPRDSPRDRLRPGLVDSGRLRVLRPNRQGPAPVPAVAPPGWAATPGATSCSSRSPTGASRSGPGPPAMPPGCWWGCAARTRRSGWPSPPPTRWPSHRDVLPRREGVEYAVEHVTPAGGGGWFLVLTNEGAQDFRFLAAPDDALGAAEAGGLARGDPAPPGRPALRTSTPSPRPRAERAGRGPDPVRVLPLPGQGRPFARRPARRRLDRPVDREPSSTWLGANPEPDAAGAAHRPHVDGHTVERPADRPGRAPGDAAEAGAGAGRLRPRPLHHLPGVGRRPGRDEGARFRWSIARTWHCRPPPCSPATGPTRSASTRRSGPIGSRSTTAASSSPSPTCAAAGRWAAPGTRTGGWSTRPTRSRTSSPAVTTCSTPGIAQPGRLAGRGGSAGGLLIGAVANQAPELFRALVAEVPFVDCVTTMLDDELPLTVGEWEEWGNPLADEAAYWRMLDLLALRQRTAANEDGSPRTYPDLFVTGGLNDPRVAYWEPAKWVAKLRAESPSTRVLAQDRAGGGPRRALGPLRRLEGGGDGLRLPARRPRAGREQLTDVVRGRADVGGGPAGRGRRQEVAA